MTSNIKSFTSYIHNAISKVYNISESQTTYLIATQQHFQLFLNPRRLLCVLSHLRAIELKKTQNRFSFNKTRINFAWMNVRNQIVNAQKTQFASMSHCYSYTVDTIRFSTLKNRFKLMYATESTSLLYKMNFQTTEVDHIGRTLCSDANIALNKN